MWTSSPPVLSYNINIQSGYAATEILRIVEEKHLDLLVMGSHGLTGLAHVLFGSTADRVIRKASCSVLTVRFRDSVSPKPWQAGSEILMGIIDSP